MRGPRSIVSAHRSFDNHISSNLKLRCQGGSSRPDRQINKGQWSDEMQCKWWTSEPGNFMNHGLFAKPRSSLYQIECPSVKCLLQVKQVPTKPRSINPHSSTTSLNCCIWPWFWTAPPNFSSCLKSSLKSPTHNHGICWLWFKFRRLSYASIFLKVSGSS